MINVLEKICAEKRDDVTIKKTLRDVSEIRELAEAQPPCRGFINSLKQKDIALIAEVKKASPSKGIIREDFDPVQIASIYEESGAACLSVLTEKKYFQGHDEYFIAIRNNVSLPMLRKDFMVDEYQIYESRALGADCILIIMAALNDDEAALFYETASTLGMDSLFEVHDEDEMQRALALNPKMLGVNNRNLKTLEVNLETGLSLVKQIPDDILKVAESGIYTRANIETFQDAGYNSFLVGESLMRENDIAQAVKSLLDT
jgi:indole-3-glycerol phosphate synthase